LDRGLSHPQITSTFSVFHNGFSQALCPRIKINHFKHALEWFKDSEGVVPFVAQRVMNTTSIYDVAASFPGLGQWVKDSGLP